MAAQEKSANRRVKMANFMMAEGKSGQAAGYMRYGQVVVVGRRDICRR
jgi:hypothetical protein